jgi:hypothetical protein
MIWVASTKVDLNPTEGVYLGCGNGKKVSPEEKLDDLEANILIVWSLDKSSKVAIISVDTLFLGRDVVEMICAGLVGAFRNDEIFIAATHTHSAPMIDETKPGLGIKNNGYAELLARRIAHSVLRLSEQKARLVTLHVYKVMLGGIIQRRNSRLLQITRQGVQLRQTLQRPKFRRKPLRVQATMAEFVDHEGNMTAMLGVIPCHPVAFMGVESLSSDYVGMLRSQYKQHIGVSADVPFVFLQGASGDLNPWLKSQWLDGGLVRIIDQLVNGVKFSLFTKGDLELWTALRVREIVASREQIRRVPLGYEEGVLRTDLQELPLSSFLETAMHLKQRFVHLHKVQIEQLCMLGVSAEVTSDLKKELEEALGHVEVAGCVRDSFGYVTSSEQYEKGGYEVDGHQSHFSISHFEGYSPSQSLGAAIKAMLAK